MATPKHGRFVSQEKSLLISEAFTGCSVGCGYCFRAEKEENEAERAISDEELVELLFNSRFFLRDKSPLSVNCNYTDPFLPETIESTFRILELLEAEGLRNIVSLITKSPLSDEDIARLESFENLDLELCVSYSAMPKKIEPVGDRHRIDLLNRLGESQLRTLLFYRPLAVGWNTSSRYVRRVLSVAKESDVDVIMVGGLLLTESLRRILRQRTGLPPPTYRIADRKKYLPDDVRQRIVGVYGELGLDIPMIRRTSCGRSVIRGMQDYNGHWAEPDKNCWPTCPYSQREVCASKKAPTQEEVRSLLGRIDKGDMRFDINPEKTVTLYEEVGRQETNFLRSNLGVMVKTGK